MYLLQVGVKLVYTNPVKLMILDDDDHFRQFLIATLEKRMGEIDAVEVTNTQTAITLFESDPYFQGFLISLDLKKGSFMEVYQHFQKHEYSIPFVIYSKEDHDHGLEHLPFIVKDDRNDFKEFTEKLFQIPPFSRHNHENEGYDRIRLFFFWRFYQLDFPLFIKINENKYVKILNSHEEYTPDFLEKYHSKGQEYLYIRKTDFSKFALSLYKKPALEMNEALCEEEKSRRKTRFIQHMAQTIGLGPDMIRYAAESVNEVIAETKKRKTLAKLLTLLEKGSSYNSDHSTLLCYLTAAMCDELGWTTRRSKEKLGFASLFHDISLTDPRLAVVNYRSLKALDRFKRSVKKRYFDHPLKGSELVLEITQEYPQVDTIIAQHHERPDGSGFPHGRDFNQIIPLAALFIVAHDFVSRLYERNFDLDNPQELLKEMSIEYTQGHFLKCMNALYIIVANQSD